MMPELNVLMTCIGGYYALDTMEALRRDEELNVRIVGVDGNPDVVNRHFVDSFHAVPMASTTPDDFVTALLGICHKESVDIVLPGADEEVYALSGVKETFAGVGVTCAVQDPHTADLTRDKVLLFERLGEAGVSLPKFAAVSSAETIAATAELLGYPKRRVIVKPRVGRGARGLIVIDAEVTETQLGSEARGYWTGNLDLVTEKLRREEGPLALMAMEFLPGDIFDVDCVARDGVPLCIVPRRRLWDTPFSRGVEGHIIERNADMEQVTEQVTETLRLSYVFDCDFGTAEDGRPGLLEVNPRWSGSVAASLAGGVNVPALLVRSIVGLPIPTVELKTGVRVLPVTRMGFPDVRG